MRARRTSFFAIGTGIDVPCEEPAGIGVQQTGRGQIDAWVDTEGYHPFRYAGSENGTATISMPVA